MHAMRYDAGPMATVDLEHADGFVAGDGWELVLDDNTTLLRVRLTPAQLAQLVQAAHDQADITGVPF